MATSSTNPVIVSGPDGGGGYASPQGIYETSASKNHPLGTKATLGSRTFYYAQAGASDIAIGRVCARAAATANHVSVAWASGGAANTDEVVVTLGATSVAENAYQDGYFAVIDGGTVSGQGQMRVIRSHTSASSTGAPTIKVVGPFTTTISTSECSLIKNEYDDVIVVPGDAVVHVVGVPQVSVTAAYYFWLQTAGPGLVEVNSSTFADGSMVTIATGTTDDAGQAAVVAATASNGSVVPTVIIGRVVEKGDASSDGDHMLIDMDISQ